MSSVKQQVLKITRSILHCVHRYIGDDHQHDQCSREVKHLWCYNVVKKVWKKKKIVLKETAEAQEPWDIECLVCDFQVK